MKRYKSDQLVIPISLPEGMAIRATAEELDVKIAVLARQLLLKGLEASLEIKPIFDAKLSEYTNMNDLQLMQEKSINPYQRETQTVPTPKGATYAHLTQPKH